jgi:hypothetical protein
MEYDIDVFQEFLLEKYKIEIHEEMKPENIFQILLQKELQSLQLHS